MTIPKPTAAVLAKRTPTLSDMIRADKLVVRNKVEGASMILLKRNNLSLEDTVKDLFGSGDHEDGYLEEYVNTSPIALNMLKVTFVQLDMDDSAIRLVNFLKKQEIKVGKTKIEFQVTPVGKFIQQLLSMVDPLIAKNYCLPLYDKVVIPEELLQDNLNNIEWD